MRSTKRVFLVAGIFMAAVIIGTAVVLSVKSPSRGGADDSTSPLGRLFQRANRVSQLKKRMGDLREVYPAVMSFAKEHQDELPRTVAELKPYLPAQLADLKDQEWELPAGGKMTPLFQSQRAAASILFQQVNMTPGKPRIIGFADGHIEYKP